LPDDNVQEHLQKSEYAQAGWHEPSPDDNLLQQVFHINAEFIRRTADRKSA
jgi:hypothetical protein